MNDLKTQIDVTLTGLADIMFDRFIDHSKEKRPPEQKFYMIEDNIVVLPSDNIISFLFGENPQGCAKSFEGKGSKQYLQTGLGHVFIDPAVVKFTNKKKPIKFEGFKDKFWINESAPRTKQGSLSIKQEIKQRPVLKTPWELSFKITIIKNPIIDSVKLFNWFERGGLMIGLGTYRPKFGRFEVSSWE